MKSTLKRLKLLVPYCGCYVNPTYLNENLHKDM